MIELGRLDALRGRVRVTLCPLGEAWVLWVQRGDSRERRHLGVLSISSDGYLFVSRHGKRTQSDDWRDLVEAIVARHR